MKKMSKKKMMTGGVNRPATVQTTPSTKGVKPNLNPKVTATPAKMSKGGKMGYGGMKRKAC